MSESQPGPSNLGTRSESQPGPTTPSPATGADPHEHQDVEQVILFCPVCCTPVDGESSDTKFTCAKCGQVFALHVDLQRQAEFSST